MSTWTATAPGRPTTSSRCWTRCRTAGVAQVPGIVYCGGQGGDQGTRALVNNLYSSSIVGTDGKWNIDANGIKALTLLQTLVNKKDLDAGMSYVASDELQQFQAETTAMTFCWGTSNAKNYASDAYTAISVPFPSDDGTPALEYLVNGFASLTTRTARRRMPPRCSSSSPATILNGDRSPLFRPARSRSAPPSATSMKAMTR
jgi:hypothetical protein